MTTTRRSIVPRRLLRRRIMGPLVLAVAALASLTTTLTAASAGLQGAPGDQAGLNVTGFGQASAPAETATIQLQVSRFDAATSYAIQLEPVREPSSDTAPAANVVQAATPEAVVEGTVSGGGVSADKAPFAPANVAPLTQADVDPLIQALTTSGVPADQIQTTLSPTLSGPFIDPLIAGSARIDVTLASPTVEGISAILTAVNNAAVANNLALLSVGVGYDVADCQALRQQAQQQAFQDAQTQAQNLATVLGVTLGELIFASEFSYSPTASAKGGCAPSSDPARSAGGGPFVLLPPFDPTKPAEAEVYSTLYLVYAMS